MPTAPLRHRLAAALHRPVPMDGLVIIRMLFGLAMSYEMVYYSFLRPWFATYIYGESIHFTYPFFGWITPMGDTGMALLIAGLFVAGLLIATGTLYRYAIVFFLVGYSYLFLCERTMYQNHWYFSILVAFLLALVPAGQQWSVDAWRKGRGWQSVQLPRFYLLAFRVLVGVVFVWAAIAKMSPDWVRGAPMDIWLQEHRNLPLVGGLLASQPMAIFLSWAGLLYDLLIIPAMLWRPTRKAAMVASVLFHGYNSLNFGIGAFPFMALASLTLFWEPGWPTRAMAALQWLPPPQQRPTLQWQPARPRAMLALLVVFCLWQMLFPARRFLYPGNSVWTHEADHFSWTMLLRHINGGSQFIIKAKKQGETRTYDVNRFLEMPTIRVLKMTMIPDLLLQAAHHIGRRLAKDGHTDIEIYVLANFSLNGRQVQPLIDPRRNLWEVSRHPLRPYDDLLVPLRTPLEQRLPALERIATPETYLRE